MNLKGKLVIITGASGGIGCALSRELIKEGAALILISKSPDSSNKLKKEFGDVHKYYFADLSSQNEVKNLVTKILADTASVDILINCAGIGIYKPFVDLTSDEFNYSLDLNLKSPFLLTKGLLSKLQKSNISLVMNIGSGAGVIPMRNRSAYCTSKFALRGLTLSLAEEYKDELPRFCLITLGSTITDFAGVSKAEKEKQAKEGRAYFPVEWVAKKLVEIIKSEDRETEYILYPGDYGFGEWTKP